MVAGKNRISSTAHPDQYSVGSLSYTRRQIVFLFGWLLLGDFSMFFIDSALPKLLPIYLDTKGYQSLAIGWIMSLGPLASVLLSPFIGVWSDRLRTRFGRRRPFLFISTPVMGLGMMLIPFIHNFTALAALVALIQVGMVLQTVVYYLYADVIPEGLIGRFMASFRIVGVLGTMCFQYFLFPYFDLAPIAIWTISGLVYLVFFQVSLHAVPEGKYAPPEKSDFRETVSVYLKDGFSTKYIWCLWGALCTIAMCVPTGYFIDLMAKKQLGLSMTDIGHMSAWGTLPLLILAFPGGWLIDKFGPKLLWGVCTVGMGILQVWGFFFITGHSTMFFYYILSGCFNGMLGVALMPMLYSHLPRRQFGQLVSVQSVVVQSCIFLSSNSIGGLLLATGQNYRLLLLYSAAFLIMTPLFLVAMRRFPNPFASEMDQVEDHPTNVNTKACLAA